MVTLTWTKTTNSVQIQTGAAYIDRVQEIMTVMLKDYRRFLRKEEVTLLVEKGSEHLQLCFIDPPFSNYLDGVGGQGHPPKLEVKEQSEVPDTEEYRAAIQDVAEGISVRLGEFPEVRSKLMNILVKDFGVSSIYGEEAMEEEDSAVSTPWESVSQQGASSTSSTSQKIGKFFERFSGKKETF